MRFLSTRGEAPHVGFSEAVATGLAPDGGLYLPASLPDFSGDLARFARLNYPELCYEFLRAFATDIPPATLHGLVGKSYTKFASPEIAPLKKLGPNLYVLELFHGPTLAFKDFALQMLGTLYEHQCRLTGRGSNVLGATSGDTGAAAIHGLLGKPQTAIFILYPDGRVSPLQERQMACTGAPNVFAIAIEGSFDDAQRVVKNVFGDLEFSQRLRLSAVNSINLARVLAQCVYYLYAWLKLPAAERQRVEFVVPTGNFGNVLAGWMLRQMGVPIPGFRVATNQNDILHRLFTRGEYRVDPVRPSLAPSMDIQLASNFERFLFYQLNCDPDLVRKVMVQITTTGAYDFADLDRSTISSTSATDAEISGIIRRVYARHGYIVDPHTACAFKELNPDRISVVLATAHPAKFPDAIRAAIGQEPLHPSLEALKSRPVVKHRLPADEAAIKAFIELHAV